MIVENIFLIAEIGINHNGEIKIAKELIKAASEAGFDSVKFQKRDVETVYKKEFLDSPRESPWGDTQRHQKEGIEFGQKEYQVIDDFCKSLKIEWFASAWDLKSQTFLQQFNLNYNKVASAMLGHKELLEMIASEKKKTFISTGMSNAEEIAIAVEIFKNKKCPFELMHCNSSYPMKEIEANLNCIKTLKDKFKCDVGYSGHETSLISISLPATILGATSIERHITLDRSMYGSDQSASIETHALKKFVTSIRSVKKIMGDGIKKIHDSELASRKKLRVIS